MSTEENKAKVRRIIEEVWNKGDLAIADDVIATNYVFRLASGQEFKGPEGLKQSVTMYRTAFPDFHITIDDMLAEEEKVAVRFTFRGTNKGEMMGIAPTGKQVIGTGAVFVRFVGGKEVEALEFADQLSMLQQMGVVPPMGQAGG